MQARKFRRPLIHRRLLDAVETLHLSEGNCDQAAHYAVELIYDSGRGSDLRAWDSVDLVSFESPRAVLYNGSVREQVACAH